MLKKKIKMLNNIFFIILLLMNYQCSNQQNTTMESKNIIKMDYEKAYEYSLRYAKFEELDYERRTKVKTEDRFRFNFNAIDMSFNNSDSILIVRACIERESAPRREDFIEIMDSLTKEYKEELAGGYLEYDETAIEVDGFKPNRLNIRIEFKNSDLSTDEFNKKVDELLTAALKWSNKYYDSIYRELNKTWEKQ